MKNSRVQSELKYLLDAGYNRQSSLDFVSNHHRLDIPERNRLNRIVFSEKEVKDHKNKLAPLSSMRGGKVAVDGYNVLITVEAILSGGEYFKCMDGFIRDNSMVFSNHRIRKATFDAIESILSVLKGARPSEVLFMYDSQVSRSGELAGYTRHSMMVNDVKGVARTSPRVDYELKKLDMITATSDSRIIGLVSTAVDLPQAVSRRLRQAKK
ncbi:MAG: DUF434 domain-containing protein [Candidatus Altiarchaeota archaeon]